MGEQIRSRKTPIVKAISLVLSTVVFATGSLFLPNLGKTVNADQPVLTNEVDSTARKAASNNVSIENFVRRLYVTCLGRNADPGGLGYWTNLIVSKKATGVSVVNEFIMSSEFQSREVTNEEFVMLMYNAFMGRTPDSGGFQYWVNKLAGGESKSSIIEGFANSQEFDNICRSYGLVTGCYVKGYPAKQVTQVNLFVERLYNEMLNRSCDRGGMLYWTRRLLSQSMGGSEIAYEFMLSQEFQNRDLTDEQFIDVMYHAFLNRNAESGGRAYWQGRLENGDSRDAVLSGFAVSNEFNDICDNYGIDSGSIVVPSTTPTPRPTNTTAPTATSTPVPTATDTPVPTATDTPVPTATDTPTPTPTSTPTPVEIGEVVVASFNDELSRLVDGYTDAEVVTVVVEADRYVEWLYEVNASGEDIPDIYAVDADFATAFFNSDYATSIADLGITDDELSAMYPYTLDFATGEDGELYGLAWSASPSVVFYNTVLAEQVFGASSPFQVSPYFADWDSFLWVARLAKECDIQIVCSDAEIFRSYSASRTTPWIVNGELDLNNSVIDFMDLAMHMSNEELTANATQWSVNWSDHMNDHTVLTYWGPMWMGTFSMGLGTDFDEDGNYDSPTAGEWRIVAPPTSTFWGGTWMVASTTCNTEAVAQVMRDLAINPDTALDIAASGDLPNNSVVNQQIAVNPDYECDWLGGQNPYEVLDMAARGVNGNYSSDDARIDDCFIRSVRDYTNGASRDEALQNFVDRVNGTLIDDDYGNENELIVDGCIVADLLAWNLNEENGFSFCEYSLNIDEAGYYTIYTTGNNQVSFTILEVGVKAAGDGFSDNSAVTVYLEPGTYSVLFEGRCAFGYETTIWVCEGEAERPTQDPITLTLDESHYILYSEATADTYVGFSFTPEVSGEYTISSQGVSDTFVQIITPDGPGLMDNDSGSGNNFSLTAYLEAGTTYLFVVTYYTYDWNSPTAVVITSGRGTSDGNTDSGDSGNQGTVVNSNLTESVPFEIPYTMFDNMMGTAYLFFDVPEGGASFTTPVNVTINNQSLTGYSIWITDSTISNTVVDFTSDTSIPVEFIPGHSYTISVYVDRDNYTDGDITVCIGAVK